MKHIILEKFANREIRLGFQDIYKAPKQAGDRASDRRSKRYGSAVLESEVLRQNIKEGYQVDCRPSGHMVLAPFSVNQGIESLRRPLDIINEFQREKEKRTKGGWGVLAKPTTFTRNARHRLLEAGAIMDADCGKNIYEITCTIPGSTVEALEAVAKYSGWIINRLLQVIRRDGRCQHWFYCWELQKRGALHLHMAVGWAEPTLIGCIAHMIEAKWWDLLLEIRDLSGVDCFGRRTGGTWRCVPSRWQSHCSPVQKSIAAYFSKYASKSVNSLDKGKQKQLAFSPARWWGSSFVVKSRIKEERERYEFPVGENYEEVINACLQFLDTPGRIRNYRYTFDLGMSANGLNLGNGWREVNYYNDQEFLRMQTWLKSFAQDMSAQYSLNAEIDEWNADIAQCRHPLHTPAKSRSMHARDQSPPLPCVKPISAQAGSLLSRVVFPKGTLDSRVLVLRMVSKGGGEDSLSDLPDAPMSVCQSGAFVQLVLPLWVSA